MKTGPGKNMKKVALSDTVFLERSRKMCSAMSTKSEIVKVMPEKRLTPRFNRNPSV